MKQEDIEFLQHEYPHWWHPNPVLKDFPDGWTDLLRKLFGALTMLNEAEPEYQIWVSVHVERYPSGEVQVFISPAVPRGRWTPGKAYFAMSVVDGVNTEFGMTCEECGALSGWWSEPYSL